MLLHFGHKVLHAKSDNDVSRLFWEFTWLILVNVLEGVSAHVHITHMLPSRTLVLETEFRCHLLLSLLTALEMSLPSERLRTINLDTALKAMMTELCHDLGLLHSGQKGQLASQFRIW